MYDAIVVGARCAGAPTVPAVLFGAEIGRNIHLTVRSARREDLPQIVGMLARRVVCRLTSGAEVRAGERLGIMKFGSRMDVFVPLSATITVKVGEAVRGGETVIAVLH